MLWRPYHKRGRCEMKVTGKKCYVQIEDDAGNIARFDGEVCFRESGGFLHPI